MHVCVIRESQHVYIVCAAGFWPSKIIIRTLCMLHELSLATLPSAGVTKVPTPGESSAASLPWMKNPLKVGLLPAAERVTAGDTTLISFKVYSKAPSSYTAS